MSATGDTRWVMALAAALALIGGARAGEPGVHSVADIPPVERFAPDFYQAIAADGAGVTAAWTATPDGGDIVLTLSIGGVANPRELSRPDLRKLSAFAERFQIEADPACDMATADGARFSYRLRPRTADVNAIPSLAYRYYRPGFPPGRRMLTTYADAIPLSVSHPAEPPPPSIPLVAPEGFFAQVPEPGWCLSFRRAWELALTAIMLVSAALAGWVALWRATHPGANRRRAKAARMALARITAAQRSGDVAGAVAEAVREFLGCRFGLPPTLYTPGEIAAGLSERGWDEVRVAEAEQFFRACDSERFAPPGQVTRRLADEAARLINAWEGGLA